MHAKPSQSAARTKKPPMRVVRTPVVEAELVEENSLVLRRPSDLARRATARADEDLYATWLDSKSELTAKNYKIDLADFAAWGGYDGIENAVSELCDFDGPNANRKVFEYKSHLKKVYSASTVNRRIAALRSITKLARIFGIIDWTLEIDGEQAMPYKDTAGCGREGVEAMLTAIETELARTAKKSPKVAYLRRAKALISCMYYGGLRRMELLTIRYPLDLRLHKQSGMQEARIAGKKRGREREWLPVGPTAWNALQDWVRSRGDFKGPLFHARASKKTPMSPTTVNEIITAIAKQAGIKATPHGIRHAAITELLERTDIRVAQRFARHSSPTTTMIYDDNRQQLAARGVTALEVVVEPKTEPKKVAKKARTLKRRSLTKKES